MPWWGLKMFFISSLILLLGLFLGPGSVFAGVSTPSIQLPHFDFDFGERDEGTILSHDFLVRNTGSEVLEIINVRPG